MKVRFRGIHKGSMLAEYELEDGNWIIIGNVINGPKGMFASLPTQQYKDKNGEIRYKKLVKMFDENNYKGFQEFVIKEYEKQQNGQIPF